MTIPVRMVDLDQLIVLQFRVLTIRSAFMHIKDLVWRGNERVRIVAGRFLAWPVHVVPEIHASRVSNSGITSSGGPYRRLSEPSALV